MSDQDQDGLHSDVDEEPDNTDDDTEAAQEEAERTNMAVSASFGFATDCSTRDRPSLKRN